MNLAFGTVLIFLIVVPGIVFRISYFHGEFSKKFIKNSAFDDFIWALVPGIFIQIFATWVIHYFELFPKEISLKTIGILLLGAKEDATILTAFSNIQDNIGYILLYNVVLTILAGGCGYAARKLIRKLKCDIKYRFLRFNNEWYYILKGEIINFPQNSFEPQKIDFVYVDVLTRTPKELIIYTGIVQAFYLSSDGGLASLLIEQVKRRVVNDENDFPKANVSSKYYSIPGRFMLLRNEDIININFRYVDAEQVLNEVMPKSVSVSIT